MRILTHVTLGMALVAGGALGTYGCSSDADPAAASPDGGTQNPPGTGTPAKGPSRGSPVALADDDSVLVMVNRDVGTVSIFAIDVTGDGSSVNATKKAELPVGAEPWQVVIASDNDTAYVVLRKDQKLVKITGLKSGGKVEGSVAVGSEPTGVALTPTGGTAWVSNWVDGTVSGVDTKTMQVTSTVDLNAALVKSGLLGKDAVARPSLAHPRSLAITNNLDAKDDDESIYVTEYYAQHVEKEAPDGANADRAKAGLVYKVKLADKSVSTIRLNPIADMGFKDSKGQTAGCYPNQLQSITVNGNFAYVSSVCASPKGPIGVVATATPPDVSNVKTTTAGAVSVIDLRTDQEAPGTASLHARFDKLFTDKGAADDATRRYPLAPVDVAFVPGSAVGYVVANGTDAAFRVRYDAEKGDISEVGSSTQLFVNLNPAGVAAAAQGKNPIGMAVSNTGKKFAFVANDVGRNLTVVDLNAQGILGGTEAPKVFESSAQPAAGSEAEARLRGKRFFNTGLARWSLKGQGWGACQSCHMDGYSDNISWYFARGPRQSTSLDGSFSKKNPSDQRVFNWTAIFDEVADFELNTRGISGGVGATVSVADPAKPPAAADRIDIAGLGHSGLAGSAADAADPQNPLGLDPAGKLKDWSEITAYVQHIRPVRGASNLDPAKVAAGRKLFATDATCQGCHGGDKWTISTRFYKPGVATTAALKTTAWTPPAGFPLGLLPAPDGSRTMRSDNGNPAAFDSIQCALRPVGTFNVADDVAGIAELRQDMVTPGQGNEAIGKGFNSPSLLSVSLGAPYLHGGNATSLESLFSPTFKDHYGALSPNFLADADPAVRAQRVQELVHFLLSIDENAETVAIPKAGAQGGDFCALP